MDWERDEIDPPDSFRMERTVEGDWARQCGMNADGGVAEARDFVEDVKLGERSEQRLRKWSGGSRGEPQRWGMT